MTLSLGTCVSEPLGGGLGHISGGHAEWEVQGRPDSVPSSPFQMRLEGVGLKAATAPQPPNLLGAHPQAEHKEKNI